MVPSQPVLTVAPDRGTVVPDKKKKNSLELTCDTLTTPHNQLPLGGLGHNDANCEKTPSDSTRFSRF